MGRSNKADALFKVLYELRGKQEDVLFLDDVVEGEEWIDYLESLELDAEVYRKLHDLASSYAMATAQEAFASGFKHGSGEADLAYLAAKTKKEVESL